MKDTAANIIKYGRGLQYSCAVYWAAYLLLKAEQVHLYLRSVLQCFLLSTRQYSKVHSGFIKSGTLIEIHSVSFSVFLQFDF